jgi:malate dehydrogenase (oxaloacetate-decarboxylating)
VTLAGLINAAKVLSKDISQMKVAMAMAGADGVAVAQILQERGVADILICDRRGIMHEGREGPNPIKQTLARTTNREGRSGTLSDAMAGANVFVGVSAPDTVTVADIDRMADDPLVFAMANLEPEISAELLARSKSRVVATGWSDHPNHINNILCFSGIFRGALGVRASEINDEMKIVAAEAIADPVPDHLLNEKHIVPSVFNPSVAESVAKAVRGGPQHRGCATRQRRFRRADRRLSGVTR